MSDFYQENARRWSAFEPAGEQLLEKVKLAPETPPRSEDEVRDWFQKLEIGDRTVLYILGIGAGETFPVIKEWLAQNSHSNAVYLEPQLSKIKTFLTTERAKELLAHPQVMLRHVNDMSTFHMASLFVLKPYMFTIWQEENPMVAETTKARIDFLSSQRSGLISEYSGHGRVFLNNYCLNLLDLPEAYLMEKLFDKFQGIPAIICGAGPSLAKNIDVLKTLGDRALIFAGATAMNALNAFNFNPHFGVGIDPNPTQYTRLIMNQAFEVPYIYKQRFLNLALETVHGDHLAITATSGYDIGKWVDKKLNLDYVGVDEGHNVVNFSTALAQKMGCNPIIFVGLDLAYTEMHSYSPGVINHPLHNLREQFHTKSHSDELVRKADIYGNPTLTLWKWIAESIWYSKLAQKHPDNLFINATEGGIGFDGIPNMPLAKVAETLLIPKHDLHGRVEQAIQQAQMAPNVTLKNVQALLDQLTDSLQKSIPICTTILESFDAAEKKIKKGEEPPPGLLDEQGLEALVELEQQDAYEALFNMFNKVFREIFLYQFEKLDRDASTASQEELNKEKVRLYRNRIKYVREGGKAVLKILEQARKKGLQKLQKIDTSPQKIAPDSEIPPNLKDYSVFYGDKGNVISVTKYGPDGSKDGLCKTYYASGELHSHLNYRQGLFEGKQLYYYRNGNLKTILHYQNGCLHGEVLLYFPSGGIKRQLNFVDGKRQGIERIWNVHGLLVVEVEFNLDKACGVARRWYENGILAQEVVFHEDGTPPDYSEWSEQGVKKSLKSPFRHDYFDQVALHTGALTYAMEHILNQVNSVVPAVEATEHKADPELRADIQKVKDEIAKMHEAGKKLLFETGLDPSNPDEAIWKTPEARKDIEGQIDKLTEMMVGEIGAIQASLAKAVDILRKKLETSQKIEPPPPPDKNSPS